MHGGTVALSQGSLSRSRKPDAGTGDEDPRWFGCGGGFSSPSDGERNLKARQQASMIRKRPVARSIAGLEETFYQRGRLGPSLPRGLGATVVSTAASTTHRFLEDHKPSKLSMSAPVLLPADTATRSRLVLSGPIAAEEYSKDMMAEHGAPPARPAGRPWWQPSETQDVLVERGWEQVPKSTVWLRQARSLAMERAGVRPPASTVSKDFAVPHSQPTRAGGEAGGSWGWQASDPGLECRLALLEHLHQSGARPGIEALCSALEWHCGSLKEAFDVAADGVLEGEPPEQQGPGQTLSVLQMTGAFALLGIHLPALMGVDEREAFRALDQDADGYISWPDLATAVKLSRAGQLEIPKVQKMDAGARPCKWVTFVRYVAISSWYCTPSHLRRRGREPLAGPGASPAETSPGSGHARQRALDNRRALWMPNQSDLQEAEQAVQIIFEQYATAKQAGELLITRGEFYRMLGDLEPCEVHRSGRPTSWLAEIGKIFDEVYEVQRAHIASAVYRRPAAKGLTFEWACLALHQAIAFLGLHFRHLVDDALDARLPSRRLRVKAGNKSS